jgi:arsenite methyltransferase
MKRADEVRSEVSGIYTRAVEREKPAGCGCCSRPSKGVATMLAGYSQEELDTLPDDAVSNSFGCGNPLALAGIREGDTVVDLGSGAGIDLLLAGRRVGPGGRVIGIDMTPAMIERAKLNIERSGLSNVEVRQGLIEDLPVESGTVDLVVSNCVINLSPEKSKVFGEISRVLRPGGRFSISDIVADSIPAWILEYGALYSSCISGAVSEAEYLDGLRKAGLEEVSVVARVVYDRDSLGPLLGSELSGTSCCGSDSVPADRLEEVAAALEGRIASIKAVGRKPTVQS